MRLTRFALLSLLPCTLLLNAYGQTVERCVPHFEPRTAFELRADFDSDPVPQIQAHLADVIAQLESRDVPGLTELQRARRREQIAALGAYAAAARFPRNTAGSQPTPVFIDRDGRACAVGHLMITSGAAGLAEQIALESNLAYVPEIRVRGVEQWMESVGLTPAECALIQPTYGPCSGFGHIASTRSSCTPTVLNSAGHAATITGCGSEIVAHNSVFLIVEGLPPSATGYFLNAREVAFVPNPGSSQGTLCLGGQIGRHGASVFTAFAPWFGPTWWAGVSLDLNQIPTPAGLAAVLPGDTWHFQCWYRDSNPASTSNFSDVLSVTFL